MDLRKVLGLTTIIFLCACSDTSRGGVASYPGREGANSVQSATQKAPPTASVTSAPDMELAMSGAEAAPSVGGLRDSYSKCASSTDGATWDMQRCIEEEFDYQDGKLNSLYQELQKKLPKIQKQSLRSDERKWISDRDKSCGWDPETEGQAQRIESNICSLRRTAERAVELERMLNKIQ